MNTCKSYNIKCPYALNLWEELPCCATQDRCDKWRKNRGSKK